MEEFHQLASCNKIEELHDYLIDTRMEIDMQVSGMLEDMGITDVDPVEGTISAREAVEKFFEKSPMGALDARLWTGSGTPTKEWRERRAELSFIGLHRELILDKINCADKLEESIDALRLLCHMPKTPESAVWVRSGTIKD